MNGLLPERIQFDATGVHKAELRGKLYVEVQGLRAIYEGADDGLYWL